MKSSIESIVTGANEVVSKIYEKIGEIDSCKAVLKNLEEAELSLLMPDGVLAELRPAIADEQLKEVKFIMERMINARIECAAEYLANVSGLTEKPPEEKPKEEPVVVAEEEWEPMMALEPEMTPADYAYAKEQAIEPEKPTVPKEVKKKVPVSKMTVAAVEQMLKDGYSVEDIAKHYNYKTTQTVYNFINKNNIKVKVLTQGNNTAKELTEKNIPEIRAMYTDGPMSLTDTAWELGTTKKKLHDFCTKHHLHKIKR